MVIGLLELPYHATSLKTPLPTRPPFTLGDYLRVAVGDRPAESLKGLCRMTNLCGVSHGQMAKVEPRETVRKGSEGPTAQAYRPPEGPCHASYTGQIHARSGARTPFRTVSEVVFSEVRLDWVLRSPAVRE